MNTLFETSKKILYDKQKTVASGLASKNIVTDLCKNNSVDDWHGFTVYGWSSMKHISTKWNLAL